MICLRYTIRRCPSSCILVNLVMRHIAQSTCYRCLHVHICTVQLAAHTAYPTYLASELTYLDHKLAIGRRHRVRTHM